MQERPPSRFTLHERWAMAAVHGQACWACGTATSLDESRIALILPETLAEDHAAKASLGLEPDFDIHGTRNLGLACPACASTGGLASDARARLDRAARRAVMVRRAALEAAYAPGLSMALDALRSRPAAALTPDDVAALVATWAGFQAKKIAQVQGTGDAYDFKRDSFAKTTIWYRPPAPLRLGAEVAIVFDAALVAQLSGLRWTIARAE